LNRQNPVKPYKTRLRVCVKNDKLLLNNIGKKIEIICIIIFSLTIFSKTMYRKKVKIKAKFVFKR
jgi:hypothetical protein